MKRKITPLCGLAPLREIFCFLTFSVTVALVDKALSQDIAVPARPAPRWWKGNLHTHTLWSDGDDFPEMVAEWYRTHDYNFLALSDHNVLSQGLRWMKAADIQKRSGSDDVFNKYTARFGPQWIETRGGSDALE